MYQRSNSRVPPIPQPGPTHHDFLLQQQLAAAQYQQTLAAHQQQASQLMGLPPAHPGMSNRMAELDVMYMQHMHQQAWAQQFAASQQSPHFPIGGHPQFPSFAAPQQRIDPPQNRQNADRRSGGHSRAHTPAPSTPGTPQQPNPFIHKTAPTTPTPTVTIPSMFSPAASDPLYSMISAEQKLRERERHLYERSRQESSFNHAAAQKMAPSQPPSFSNSIFNKPDLQPSPRLIHPSQPSPKPALSNDIANHYPLDLSSAPSRINCENYEPVRVVAPSVQREIDRLKAEKERRKLLKAQKSSNPTSVAKIRPRNASISSESSKKAPKKPKNLPENSPNLPNTPQAKPRVELPPQIQSILSQPEPVAVTVPPSTSASPIIHFPEIGKAENRDCEKDTDSNKAVNESNSNISPSTPYLQQQLHQNQNQLLLQQHQQQQQQQSSSHSLTSAQSLLNHQNQSKDIIRTHEDYIRCKARILKDN